MNQRVSGACHCGKVKIRAQAQDLNIGVCHCGSCRKRTGGSTFNVDCGANVAFEGEENIGIYDSSAWAERGFCKHCGTNLFYRLKESQKHMMSIGVFSDDIEYSFHHQIFIDEKPKFYSFANETENLTGAEVFAKYSN